MHKKILQKLRVVFLFVLIFVLLSLAMIKLMEIQIVDGQKYLQLSMKKTVGTQEIVAPRGEIVDINGEHIVKNEVGFAVIVEKAFFPNNLKEQNETLLEVVEILEEENDFWIESIPISKTLPYEFLDNKNSDISKLKKNLRLNTYSTAQNCIDALIEKYELENYSQKEQRILAGIRYEMLLAQFSVSNSYILAEDILEKNVAKIKENLYNLLGINIIELPMRAYVDGEVLPHEIGTVGPIYSEEYAVLKEQGYKLNDTLGKSGIEKAFEKELKETNGNLEVTISSADREIVNIKEGSPVIPGNSVKLTIDKEFQKEVQLILQDTIQTLQSQEETEETKGINAKGGAMVVLDVKTGAVKALASYPYYDINDYINDYQTVASGENNPLVNRATDGLYRPGSTFKPITAIAALNEGHITPKTLVNCDKYYDYYGIMMRCTGYHGDINVVTAIEKSCNLFFYQVSQLIGIETLVEYEKIFGLGTNPDLEIGASVGYLSCPETLDNLGIGWTSGQLLQAAIGQSEVMITPLQMAMEALTIANKGVRYKPYIVDSVWDYNLENIIYKTEPKIEAELEIKQDYDIFESVIQGMKNAANYTYVSPVFDYEDSQLLDLPFPAAIKTGTPQNTKTTTSSAFIGFYPADNPEIAFSGYLESGEYSKYMIRKMINAYYNYEN